MSDTENTYGETMEYSYNNSEHSDISMKSDSEYYDSDISMKSDSEYYDSDISMKSHSDISMKSDSDISILGSDNNMSESEDEVSDVSMNDLEPILSDSYFSDSDSEEIFDTNIIKEKELNNLSHNPKLVPKKRKRISKKTSFYYNKKFVSGSKDRPDYYYDP